MKKYISSIKNAGFTLIELLVVLGIIGVLAGIVYASFSEARMAARDDVRKTELRELQLALELYKAQYGRYPAACGNAVDVWRGNVPGPDTGVSFACGPDYIIGHAAGVNFVPDFISSLPTDPNSFRNRGYLYRVDAGGTAYKLLLFHLVELKKVTSYPDEFARCPQPTGTTWCPNTFPTDPANQTQQTYAVYSSGAETW